MDTNFLLWIFVTGGITAGFVIAIVILIYLYIKPALDSPARFFIKAKRKKMPVYILDDGNKWRFVIPEYLDNSYAKTKSEVIFRGDKGAEKMAYGGVLVGVGENERSLLVSAKTAEMIAKLKEKGVDPDKLREILNGIRESEKEVDKEKDKKKWRLVDLSTIRDFVNFALNKNLINLIIKRNVDVETREQLMKKKPERDWGKIMMYLLIGMIVVVFVILLVKQVFGTDAITRDLIQCQAELAKMKASHAATNMTKIIHG